MVSVVLLAAYRQVLAQADWLEPKIGGHLAQCCIHHMNRVNSCNASSMMTAP